MVAIRAVERWKVLGAAWVLALLALLQSGVHAQTKSVRLGWKPSPSPEVTGYTLYYGLSTGQYTSRLEAGNATNVVVNGLSNNIVYYFTIVAHDDTGLDSPPSNEVVYQVPGADEAPVITVQPMPQEVPAGGSVTFAVAVSGTAPLTYQWQLNGSPIAGATASSYTKANVQLMDEGAYSVVVTNLAGSITSSSASLVVIQPPVITSQPIAQSIVQGSNVTFTVTASGSAPLAYQWRLNGFPIAGATASAYTKANVQIADGGQYSVQVANVAGAIISSGAALTVIQPPTITAQPVAQSIVQGSNVTFSVTASGSAPLAYQWCLNGTPIAGATAGSYTKSNVQAVDAGGYSVVVTNLAGLIVSSSATLTVLQPPSITAQPVAQSVIQGSNITFTVTASGATPLAYQWRLNGSPIEGATSRSHTRANVQPADEGSYSVVVTNLAGSIVSSSASLTVLVPPAINTQPLSQSITQGSNVTFSVTASGSAPLAYQWRFNGSVIAGATASSYTRPNVQLTDEGAYSVMVTNLAGSIISSGANLTLMQPPAIVSQPLAQSVVLGSNAVFSVVATGSTPLAYQWFHDSSAITGATNDAYTTGKVGLEAEGEYSVRVSNAAGFTLSSGARLIVLQPPSISAQPLARTVVQGSSTTFTVMAAGSEPLEYQWRFNGAPIGEATAGSYTKSDVQPADAGEYSVLVSNMAGTVTSSVATLTVVEPPVIVTQPVAQSVIQGTNATFTVSASGTAPLAFQWSFNGSPIAGANASSYTRYNVQLSDAGQYSVTITNLAGSATSSGAALTIIQLPVIITQPVGQSVVQGSNVTFTVSAYGTPPLEFQWSVNGVAVAGANASSYTKSDVQPADAGQYAVTVTNPAGSVTSSSVALRVIEPPLILSQPLAQAAALGSRVTFSVSASGTGPLAYAWRFNGLPMAGATNSSYTIESVGPENEASYVVEVKNVAGSVLSSAATLTVTEVPVVNVGPADAAVAVGSNASFTVMASGTAPLAYQWLFNGTVIVGATATNLVINNVQTDDVGLYSVQITNTAGSTVSPAASLSLIYAPTITKPPLPQATVIGASASFRVEASGTALTYQWFWDDSPIEGSTNAVYTIAETSFANAGNYRVEVSNPAGTVSSPPALLRVVDRTIAGRVSYYSSYPPVGPELGIGEVTVSARNESTLQVKSTSTTTAGAYELGGFDTGYGITVTPAGKTEAVKLAAISALDMALVDRHMRGGLRLDSPYKLLAADVDLSGEIDEADVRNLKSLLLSSASQLPKGTWRFVPADYRFADPTNPWDAPASQGYADLTGTPEMVNFIGIKLGDADGSWAAQSPPDGDDLSAPVVVRPSGLQGTNGELVTASISVEAFTNVTSIQFTLAWDPSVLELVDTGGYTLRGVNRDSFGPATERPGELRFVWHDPELAGVTLLDGTRLFTVAFRMRGVAGQASSLQLVDSELGRQVSTEFRETAFSMPGSTVTVQAATDLRVTNVSFTPGGFTLSASSELGVRYYIEYTTLEAGEDWEVLGFFDGDGTVKTFEDPAATNSARFYRVRTELISP